MLRLIATLAGMLVLSAGALMLGTAAAHAAAGGNGPNALTIQADCGGGPIDVVINLSAGGFSAAHPVEGGAFVPTSFGEVHGMFTDGDGNEFPFTDPPVTKGQSVNSAAGKITCSFDFTAPLDGGTLRLAGTVTGFITPHKVR